MNRAATLTLSLLALASTADAKDLQGVFEDALQNDPVIRQADANRLASREARPQAWAAVLPQFNGTAGVTRDHTSGFQGQVAEVGNPNNPSAPPSLVVVQLPETIDTTTKTWALNLRSNLFSWTNWMQIKAASKEVAQAEATYQAAEQDLILRVATAYFVVLAADDTLLANQASLEAITPTARSGQQALRGRTHRHHRRTGGQGRPRHRRGDRDRRQAHPRHRHLPAAGDHRPEVRSSVQARRRRCRSPARTRWMRAAG